MEKSTSDKLSTAAVADCSLKIFPDPENPYQRILL
ncbi:hypothetical protein T05_10682 [Trichinella murrelli]|uniref:Uncharacterized protein n=1 Tax=Trichinella murrelli TaxID=144512 RepID=A0A0V0SUE2_9BILA|nr:hypothetical protein T05_10682 [Trichinella murrelli]